MVEIKNKKILLIGGAGFIGHRLALNLSKLGAEVFIGDNCQVNNLVQHQGNEQYRNFILERFDLFKKEKILHFYTDARNYHYVSWLVRETKPDIVIHLAAVAHANKSNKDPFSTFDHSLRTLENSLDACHKQVKQFVYFSSSMVYGDFKKEKVFESDELNPKGIYGALKVSGELIVKAYNEVFGTPYTIIRPSALYGERCVSRRVVQIFIENAFEGKELVIQGDGKEKLDFTYIDDLVQGVCLCIGNKKAYNETFNLTYGEAESINTVAMYLQSKFGCKITRKERDKLMPIRGTLSIHKAKRILGYNPKYSVKKGIDKYIGWYKKNVYSNKR